MDGPESIAIVGIGCKFPGANNIDEFWNVLVQGEDHVQDIPKERFNVDAFYDANPDAAGKLYMKKAGLVKGFTEWDCQFYGIGEKEAKQMDPQQRFVLDCVHMAMEDGGITKQNVSGTGTGVYIDLFLYTYEKDLAIKIVNGEIQTSVYDKRDDFGFNIVNVPWLDGDAPRLSSYGMMNDDYKLSLLGEDDLINNYTVTGSNSSIISARVSYMYNLLGPSIVLDTACSSALVAIHLAASAMKSGDISMAICGGVSCVFNPEIFISLSKAKMASPTGKCQTFSKYADGYARGEGCGIIILKKLGKAMEDNNKVWGIIATGCNQDGRTTSPITAPSSPQQIKLLEKVFEENNICPCNIQYIEAHGTGTPVGDPIEANALGSFFSKNRKKETAEIFIGSVKTNIGHLESAAGVAGLIKILLMMKHGVIVPSLHSRELNSRIEFQKYHLAVPQVVTKWFPVNNEERVACINSFGFGGTNSHAIVKEIKKNVYIQTMQNKNKLQIIILSANDTVALKHTAEKYAKDLKTSVFSLESLAYTSTVRRDHYRFRTFLVCESIASLPERIDSNIHDMAYLRPVPLQAPSIVFVFCGVGTAWQGMCKDFMERFAVFRNTVQLIDSLILPLTEWSIFDTLANGDSFKGNPMINHIAIFTCQIALVHLWRSFGISPMCVIGQSVGEVAAAYTSGALSLEQAVTVIYHRSHVLAEATGGVMAVVRGVNIQDMELECKALKSGKASIAVYISSECCTVSGDKSALEELRCNLEPKREVRWVPLDVQCAYHSHFTKEPGLKLEAEIRNLTPKSNQIPVFSSVTGALITSKDYCTSTYWASNVTDKVKFYQALIASRQLSEDPVYIEIGPSPVLRSHVANVFPDNDIQVIPSMTKNSEIRQFLWATGNLTILGLNLHWTALFEHEPPLADIPTYCFNCKPLFEESVLRSMKRSTNNDGGTHGFLLEKKSRDSFSLTLSEQRMPYVFEHVVEGSIIVPGALYGAIGLEVGKQVLGLCENVEVGWKIETPLAINAKQSSELSIYFDQKGHSLTYRVSDGRKHMLSRGSISKVSCTMQDQIDIREQKERIDGKPNDEFIYKTLRRFGFHHGPLYQIVRKGLYSNEECFAEVNLTDSHPALCNGVDIHPIIIDSMLQCCCAFLPFFDIPQDAKLLPVDIGKLSNKQKVTGKMYIYCRVLERNNTNFLCNAVLLQDNGIIVAEMLNIQIKLLNMPLNGQELSLCYSWNKLVEDNRNLSNLRSQIIIITRKRNSRDYLLSKTKYDILCQDDYKNFDVVKDTILSKKPNIVAYLPGSFDEQIDNQEKYKEILSDGHFFLKMTKTFSHLAMKIVVITEATQKVNIENQKINLLGSELWGMTRSIAMEPTKISFHLIDTYPNVGQNLKSIDSLLKRMSDDDEGIPFETCVINDEVLYGFIRQVHTKSSPQTASDYKQTLSHSCGLPKSQKKMHQAVDISISSACRNIFDTFKCQNAPPKTRQIWRADNENQIGMKCVEFVGTSNKHYGQKDELICCYPTYLRPDIVVPKQFVCPKDDIPSYSLGMFQTCILAMTIAEYVVDARKIIAIANDDFVDVVRFLEQFFNEKKIKMCRISDIDCISSSETAKACLLLLSSSENYEPNLIERGCFSKAICFDHNSRYVFHDNEITEIVYLAPEKIFSLKNISRRIKDAKRYLTKFTHQKVHPGLCCGANVDFVKESIISHTKPKNCQMLVRENSSYIVVGGFTGLGWLLVKHLARCHAKKIIVFSRRVPEDEMKTKMQRLNNFYGVQIVPIKVDICNLQNLLQVFLNLKSLCKNEPIRGIFHGAAVTADKFASEMTMDQFEIPLRPKILGTLNLDHASRNLKLDYFVTHSSVAALLGNVGQCNYAAGNSFQDCFTLFRRSHGRPATSIIWGALDTGLAADTFTRETLRSRGFNLLTQQQIVECTNIAIISGEVHNIFAHIDWRAFLQDDIKSQRIKFKDVWNDWSFSISSKLANSKSLHVVDDESIMKMVLECLAGVFAIHPSQMSAATPIVEFGLDSQKGTELASLIFDRSNVRVPYLYLATDDHSALDIVKFVKNKQEMGVSNSMTDEASKDAVNSNTHLRSLIEDIILADTNVVYHEVHLLLPKAKMDSCMIQNALQILAHLHPLIRTRFHIEADEDGKKTLRKEVMEEEDGVLQIEVKDDTSFIDPVNVRDVFWRPLRIEILRRKRDIKIILRFCPLLIDTCSIVCITEESKKLIFRFGDKPETALQSPRYQSKSLPEKFDDLLCTDGEEIINFWKSELALQKESVLIESNKINDAIGRTSIQIPEHIVGALNEKLARSGISKFQAMCCFAQVGLVIVTKASSATILAQTDMRPIVGIDEQALGMYSNLIPLIADFSNSENISLHEFLTRSVRKLKSMEEKGTFPFQQIKQLPEFKEAKHQNLICMFIDETKLKESENKLQIIEYRSGFSSLAKVELMIVTSIQHMSLYLASGENFRWTGEALLKAISNILQLYVYNAEVSLREALAAELTTEYLEQANGKLFVKETKTFRSIIEPKITNSQRNGLCLQLGNTKIPLLDILSVDVSDKDNMVLVIKTKKKDFSIYADNLKTCQMWMAFINSKINRHQQGWKWKGSQSSLFQCGVVDELVEDELTYL